MQNLKSLRDCLEEGLKAAERKTFLYRVIYVGQHNFKKLAALKEYFQRNVNQCNNEYCDEKLTGFLLCYPNLLIHLIEGSEDVIYSHFDLLCKTNRAAELHDLKVVIIWPHLIERTTLNWFVKSGLPKKSDIEVYSTCQASPFVRLCINSMCTLSKVLYERQTSKMEDDHHIKGQQMCESESKNIDSIPNEFIPKLPDGDQIEFLTKCTVLVSLQEVYESMYFISRIPYTGLYKGMWGLDAKGVMRPTLSMLGEKNIKSNIYIKY